MNEYKLNILKAGLYAINGIINSEDTPTTSDIEIAYQTAKDMYSLGNRRPYFSEDIEELLKDEYPSPEDILNACDILEGFVEDMLGDYQLTQDDIDLDRGIEDIEDGL